jgi:hypothetical protein
MTHNQTSSYSTLLNISLVLVILQSIAALDLTHPTHRRAANIHIHIYIHIYMHSLHIVHDSQTD